MQILLLEFKDVIENELKKEPVDVLIIQAGSVDITNLKTGDGNEETNAEYFAQQTTNSATNLFKAAINAAVKYPKLKKIVMMRQTPRYDPANVNPLSIKGGGKRSNKVGNTEPTAEQSSPSCPTPPPARPQSPPPSSPSSPPARPQSPP